MTATNRRRKGSGSLAELRPGVWRLRVFIGSDPRTGTRRTVSRTVKGSSKVAERALARFMTEVDEGRFYTTSATVAEVLDRWLENIRRTRALSTIRDYEGLIETTLKPALGHHRIAQLGPHQLDAWYRYWVTEEVAPGRRRSRTTVLKYHHVITAALEQAVRWGWIERNPAKRATPPKAEKSEMAVPTPDELMRMVRQAEADRPVLGAAVALAALTGMRRGELCALRWSDVQGETIIVSHSLTVTKGGEMHLGDTKTHATRVLALDTVALETLRRRRAFAEDVASQAGVSVVPDAFVLSERADSARPILPDTLTHWFGDLMAAMGLPFHLHHLRHFMVTTALAAGVDVRSVAGRSGHKDASLMLRVYAHAVEAQDRLAAEALGRALAPALGRALGPGETPQDRPHAPQIESVAPGCGGNGSRDDETPGH